MIFFKISCAVIVSMGLDMAERWIDCGQLSEMGLSLD